MNEYRSVTLTCLLLCLSNVEFSAAEDALPSIAKRNSEHAEILQQFPPDRPLPEQFQQFEDPRQMEFDDRRSLEFFPERRFDAISLNIAESGWVTVVGTIVRLAGCWSVFADGRESGAMEVAELPAAFQEVGLRVTVTLGLAVTAQDRCRDSMPIGQIALLDDNLPPAHELRSLYNTVMDRMTGLSIAGRVTLEDAHVEVSGIDVTEAGELRNALNGAVGMLAQHYDRGDEQGEQSAMISVWPLADFQLR